jgi:hypothetical protein
LYENGADPGADNGDPSGLGTDTEPIDETANMCAGSRFPFAPFSRSGRHAMVRYQMDFTFSAKSLSQPFFSSKVSRLPPQEIPGTRNELWDDEFVRETRCSSPALLTVVILRNK